MRGSALNAPLSVVARSAPQHRVKPKPVQVKKKIDKRKAIKKSG
jgi:hypothetical protein